GNATYQTGRPITFFSGSNTFSSSVQTPASCVSGCDPYMGHMFTDTTIGQQFYFNSAQKALLSLPAPGEFGNLGRNYFRQGINANLNATITKKFRIAEGHDVQARLEMQNVTNSQMFDTFGSQSIQSSVFTRLNQSVDGVMNNTARRMQLSLKYTF
ncbi:MAG TPA: hypothetical protein VFM10_10460, partial [Terriglobales bacterium]|nr:hypothetical protein [Terriglobales bacterium]